MFDFWLYVMLFYLKNWFISSMGLGFIPSAESCDTFKLMHGLSAKSSKKAVALFPIKIGYCDMVSHFNRQPGFTGVGKFSKLNSRYHKDFLGLEGRSEPRRRLQIWVSRRMEAARLKKMVKWHGNRFFCFHLSMASFKWSHHINKHIQKCVLKVSPHTVKQRSFLVELKKQVGKISKQKKTTRFKQTVHCLSPS